MSKALNVMKAFASARYPNEACGVVVKDGDKEHVIECENVAPNPERFFMIAPEEYSRIADGHDILAIWHSHVELPATPSNADKACCEALGVPWYILSISRNPEGVDSFSDLTVFNPSGFEMPYLERPYVFGVFDCYSLVRDFYKREFDIEMSAGPRVDRFWEKGIDLFGEHWKEEGFVRLSPRTVPQRGDLFLMQMSGKSVNNHIAIYLGDGMIMHHCHDRLSRRDIYGGVWLKHTTLHLRHESKC